MTHVYVHRFPNGKVYIGIADNPIQRWQGGAGYQDNAVMYADILFYGWQNIEHIIVAECATREEAQSLEREYILLYDSENPEKGYNQTGIKSNLLKRVSLKNPLVEGFGEQRTAADWARIAGVHRSTFGRYLKQGLTVEEIFKARQLIYRGDKNVAKLKKLRKPRMSAAMKETRDLMYFILTLSGYTLDEGKESVEVKPSNNQTHLVAFKGKPFGEYNYRTGVLKLGFKTGIPLKMPGLENPMVRRTAAGLWEPHPETVREMHRLKQIN